MPRKKQKLSILDDYNSKVKQLFDSSTQKENKFYYDLATLVIDNWMEIQKEKSTFLAEIEILKELINALDRISSPSDTTYISKLKACLNNIIGDCYLNEDMYNKSLKFYKKNIPFFFGEVVSIQKATFYFNIAECYRELGNSEKNNYYRTAAARCYSFIKPSSKEYEQAQEHLNANDKELRHLFIYKQTTTTTTKDEDGAIKLTI